MARRTKVTLTRFRRNYKKYGNKVTKAYVKKMINTNISQKGLYTRALSSTTFTNNLVYTFNLSAQIRQGDDIDERQGDNIRINSINAKIWYAINMADLDTNVATAHYEVFILKTNSEVNPSTSQLQDTAAGGLAAAEIYTTLLSPQMHNAIDYNQVTILKRKHIKVTSQEGIDNGIYTGMFNIGCKVNRPFKYKQQTLFGKTENYYLVVLPYSHGNPTNVGTFLTTALISFQD